MPKVYLLLKFRISLPSRQLLWKLGLVDDGWIKDTSLIFSYARSSQISSILSFALLFFVFWLESSLLFLYYDLSRPSRGIPMIDGTFLL